MRAGCLARDRACFALRCALRKSKKKKSVEKAQAATIPLEENRRREKDNTSERQIARLLPDLHPGSAIRLKQEMRLISIGSHLRIALSLSRSGGGESIQCCYLSTNTDKEVQIRHVLEERNMQLQLNPSGHLE